jgi:hypothetical protein
MYIKIRIDIKIRLSLEMSQILSLLMEKLIIFITESKIDFFSRRKRLSSVITVVEPVIRVISVITDRMEIKTM